MNFQYEKYKEPIKVIVLNPLATASKLLIVKIMSGYVFGNDQLIDFTLVTYLDEINAANAFKRELELCAFSYANLINITSELPSVSDGDIFCLITDLCYPNYFNLSKVLSDEQFDALYLVMKLTHNLKWGNGARKPIFMTDGLISIDILNSFSKDIPPDIFLCPTSITTIAKCVLADYLEVECNLINDVYVWGANDIVFHIEVEKPIIINDVIENDSDCLWDMIGRDTLKKLKYDTTQFSSTWMNKELINKVASSARKNPYGCIYRAAEFAQTLRDVWIMRTKGNGGNANNIGIISDGTLGTVKGYPYIMPIEFSGTSWHISQHSEDNMHLKQEIKRINKASKLHHEKLIKYCSKFLEENVIKQKFVWTKKSSLAPSLNVN